MTSKLRASETEDCYGQPAMSDSKALRLIRAAVGRRRGLGFGKLDLDGDRHCAMGAFFSDHPRAVVNTELLDMVAAVNDSVPPDATPKERWQHVYRWLKWKTEALDRSK